MPVLAARLDTNKKISEVPVLQKVAEATKMRSI
jgi:hypothetical protein